MMSRSWDVDVSFRDKKAKWIITQLNPYALKTWQENKRLSRFEMLLSRRLFKYDQVKNAGSDAPVEVKDLCF